MRATEVLLSEEDVRQTLGAAIRITQAAGEWNTQPMGQVLRAAAADSAYTRFTGGALVEGEERPVAVGSMALVFSDAATAAEAAHLRTDLDGTPVAVETVTAPNGLVSYWGFLHRDSVILIITLDTLDPQEVSMSEFRGLITRAVERLKLH